MAPLLQVPIMSQIFQNLFNSCAFTVHFRQINSNFKILGLLTTTQKINIARLKVIGCDITYSIAKGNKVPFEYCLVITAELPPMETCPRQGIFCRFNDCNICQVFTFPVCYIWMKMKDEKAYKNAFYTLRKVLGFDFKPGNLFCFLRFLFNDI